MLLSFFTLKKEKVPVKKEKKNFPEENQEL